MMSAFEQLFTPKVLICVARHERSIAMSLFLDRQGCQVHVVTSVREAQEKVKQVLPHVIFSETQLVDGLLGDLANALKDHEIFEQIPLFAHVAEQKKEELLRCRGVQLAGVMIGRLHPEHFLQSYRNYIENEQRVSGHSMVFSPYGIAVDPSLEKSWGYQTQEVRPIGKAGNFLIYQSFMRPQLQVGVKLMDHKDQVWRIFSAFSFARSDRSYVSLAPISKVGVSHSQEYSLLPEVKLANSEHHVQVFGLSQEDFTLMQKMCYTSGHKLSWGGDLNECLKDKAKLQKLSATTLLILDPDRQYTEAQTIHDLIKLTGEEPPAVVYVGREVLAQTSVEKWINLSYPLSLETLLQALEAVRAVPSLSASLPRIYKHSWKIVQSVQVVALDEQGAILRSESAAKNGDLLHLDVRMLHDLGCEQDSVRVENCFFAFEGGVYYIRVSLNYHGQTRYDYLRQIKTLAASNKKNDSQEMRAIGEDK